MLSYWDRSIITDKMVDFNRPDTVLTENRKALVIDIAFPLNHNLSKTGAEKITNMKTLPWK